MAVSYTSKKCDSCGGGLEYIKARKVWQCRYCGQEIVREESYDGLFTIKNVVRQALADVAYRRMDQAQKNLTECEKIDSGYIGTLLARICFRLIAFITPGACPAEEAAGLSQRLKNDYAALKARGAVEEDEEALYEFLADADSAADIFATMVLVFDSLGDTCRTEYAMKLLEPEKVYSKPCNRDLLTYSLKHGLLDTARAIAANTAALDQHSALDVILDHCPDTQEKAEMAAGLLAAGAYTSQDRAHMQSYLSGADSPGTKAALLAACKGTGAMPDMESMVRYVLSQCSGQELEGALEGVCSGHLHDSELYYLLEYALSEQADKAELILAKLAASGQFALISGKHLRTLFLDTSRSAQDRLRIWRALAPFQLDNKAAGAVVSDYLCGGGEGEKDSPADRDVILSVLLEQVKAVQPACLERYLSQCTLDGARKPQVVKALFALEDMRPSYFSDTLGSYLRRSPDEPAVTQAVTDALIQAGLTLSSAALSDLICAKGGPAAEKVELLRRLEQNGCALRADALSLYLETACVNGFFEEEMLAYLYDRVPAVSERGISSYVLHCSSVNKAQNAAALAAKQATPFGCAVCQVVHLSHRISCSLAQAYLLTSADPCDTASSLLRAMAGNTKLTADIQVDGGMVRFKKYVKENRAALSALTAALCEEHRLFSAF